jgi:hypothetical protein
VGDVGDYEALSIQGRLAAGLVAVEAWLRQHGVEDEGTTSLLDHMWQWMTVAPETFKAWYEFQSAALRAAEAGEPVPSVAAAACRRQGASAHDLASMLADVVSVVYDSLFGALDLRLSLVNLARLAEISGKSGVHLPDASQLSQFPAPERHGWGNPVSAADITALRSRLHAQLTRPEQ